MRSSSPAWPTPRVVVARRGLQRVPAAGNCGHTSVDWVRRFPNLLLSPALILQGLRAWPRAAHSATASRSRNWTDLLNRVRQPFNLQLAGAVRRGRRAGQTRRSSSAASRSTARPRNGQSTACLRHELADLVAHLCPSPSWCSSSVGSPGDAQRVYIAGVLQAADRGAAPGWGSELCPLGPAGGCG